MLDKKMLDKKMLDKKMLDKKIYFYTNEYTYRHAMLRCASANRVQNHLCKIHLLKVMCKATRQSSFATTRRVKETTAWGARTELRVDCIINKLRYRGTITISNSHSLHGQSDWNYRPRGNSRLSQQFTPRRQGRHLVLVYKATFIPVSTTLQCVEKLTWLCNCRSSTFYLA